MKTASVLAAISLVGLVALALVHRQQSERLHRVEAENWALRGRLDDLAAQLDQLAPLSRLLARSQRSEIEKPYAPEQVTGPPNAGPVSGDSPLAWCPPEANSGRPWLRLIYPAGPAVKGLEVHANWNPGAIAEVTAVFATGATENVWQGAPLSGERITVLPFARPVEAARFILTLDPARVPGWNEIDAVRAVFTDESGAWAEAAEASGFWRETAPE